MKRKERLRTMLNIRALSRWFLLTAILLLLVLILTSAPAHAQTLSSRSSSSAHHFASGLAGPAMTVTAGFDTRYRDGNWIPVRVTLRNDGPDFNGKVSINVPAPRPKGTTPGTTASPNTLSVYEE